MMLSGRPPRRRAAPFTSCTVGRLYILRSLCTDALPPLPYRRRYRPRQQSIYFAEGRDARRHASLAA